MKLLVAVEQGQTWIVSNEIHFCFLVASQHENIFQHSCHRLSRDASQLKAMPVKMDRMDIVTGVTHPDAVALALLQVK